MKMAKNYIAVTICLLGYLFHTESAVFIKQDQANQVLYRPRRANYGFLEEFLQGNLERECIEEVCDYEEAREVFEDDAKTAIFWRTYTGKGLCFPNPCMNGGFCHEENNNYSCLCKRGYEGRNCEHDFTCKANNGGCKQICKTNHLGQAVCSCAQGYQLGKDWKSCEPAVAFPCGRITSPEAVNNKPTAAPRDRRNKLSVQIHAGSPNQELVDTDSKKGEVPWQVYMFSFDRKGLCGGAAINEKWILTSAHCLESAPHTVVAGEYNTSAFDQTEQLRRIVKAVSHPMYNASNKYQHDLALLELDSPLDLSPYVTPVCIVDKEFTSSLLENRVSTVSGWWKQRNQRKAGNVLQVRKVRRVEEATCQRRPDAPVLPGTFCGTFAIPEEAHQLNSGSPHVTKIQDTWFLTAVTTCGEECVTEPQHTIFTSIADYTEWMRNTIQLEPLSQSNTGSTLG